MYFLYHGSVDVRVGETVIAWLHTGAMFGCFDPVEKIRHRLAITATEPTDLLSIDATLFYELIKTWPKIQSRMNRAMILKPEFIESVSKDGDKFALMGYSGNSVVQLISQKKKRTIWYLLKTILMHAGLKRTQKWFPYWYFFIHVVVSFVSVMVILIHIGARLDGTIFLFVIYGLDLLFLTKIYVEFRTGLV